MHTLLSILLFTLFPFHLLPYFGSGVQGKELSNEIVNSPIGEVKGIEKSKTETKKEEPIVTYVPSPQRKDEAMDLNLNGPHSAIILDAESGNVLYYLNGKERRPIASLTKVLTAILVMENVKNLDEDVTITQEAVYIEGTRIGCPRSGYCVTQRLKVGEKISVRSLLKAMLMNSANDAAYSLGVHMAGSQEEFAKMMNKKVKELGLNDSNFCTASGLEIEGKEAECYSSAYDLARIAAYSLKYDLIWQIFRLPNNTEIASSDGKIKHQILNTDQVLDSIPNNLGGKTGFTPLAGRSLMMAATDDTRKHKVVAVLLDDPYRWQNIKTMFDWTFKSYNWK